MVAKRTKQVDKMVEYVNNILRNNRVIDEYDSDFFLMQGLLLETNTYQGFNYFYDFEYTDVVGNKTIIQRLAGTSDKEKLKELDGYIQLY